MQPLKLIVSLSLSTAVYFSPQLSIAKPLTCSSLFAISPEILEAKHQSFLSELSQKMNSNYDSQNINTFRELNQFKESYPSILTIDNGVFYKNLVAILVKEEKAMEHKVISKVLQLTTNSATSENLPEVLKKNFIAVLSEIYGPKLAKKVVTAKFSKPNLIDTEFMAVSFQNAYKGIFGSPEKVLNLKNETEVREPETLLEKFMFEAKDQLGGRLPEVFKSSFVKGPGNTELENEKGPERIFVSLDSRTGPIYAKYFLLNNPQVLTHFHTEQQGTLWIAHMGKKMTYAQMDGDIDGARLGNNSGLILPAILFSSNEGSRINNYFQLGTLSGSKRSKYGWAYTNVKTKDNGETEIERYCKAVGGYKSCTHWIGDIPVGDKIVKKVMYPGNYDIDRYGSLFSPEIPDNKKELPRYGKVQTYNAINLQASYGNWFSPEIENNTLIGNDTRLDRLTRIVWQQNQSPAQMWQVLGLKDAQIRGELANPGYVLYSLLGSADNKRVPVVFITRPDSTQPITQNEIDNLKSKIRAF